MRARGHGDFWGKSKGIAKEGTEKHRGNRNRPQDGVCPSWGVRGDERGICIPRPRRGKPRLYENDD